MRNVNLDISIILDLVVCAETYGYAKPILLDAFAEIVQTLSDEEITTFVTEHYYSEEAIAQGYTEEDYEVCIETLTNWRNQYLNN